MKKLIYLFLVLIIVACSSDSDDSSNDPFACADFDETTSSSIARQEAINYQLEDYNELVSLYGDPIDDGYFSYDNGGPFGTDFQFAFLFEDIENNSQICYTVGVECVTYTYSVGCANITSIDDCTECVNVQYWTRIG
jgi:hypothetical protein